MTRKEKRHLYYLKNREIILKKVSIYRNQNKKKISINEKEYCLKYPWRRVYNHINDRCNNPKSSAYKNYGGRGIKNFLSLEDVKKLWLRDKAYLLKEPSIDRIDNDGNYTFDNCRFIEFDENREKAKLKPILQFDLRGNFIRAWSSAKEACEILNLHHSLISKCLYNNRKSTGGFTWSLKK